MNLKVFAFKLLVVFNIVCTTAEWYSSDNEDSSGYYSSDKYHSHDKYHSEDKKGYYSPQDKYHSSNDHVHPTHYPSHIHTTDEYTLRHANHGDSHQSHDYEYHKSHDHQYHESHEYHTTHDHDYHSHDTHSHSSHSHDHNTHTHSKHGKHGAHDSNSYGHSGSKGKGKGYHAMQNNAYSDVYGVVDSTNTSNDNNIFIAVMSVIAFLLLGGIIVAIWCSSVKVQKNPIQTKHGHVPIDNVDDNTDEEVEVDIIEGWNNDDSIYEEEHEENQTLKTTV
eukprot:241583_1